MTFSDGIVMIEINHEGVSTEIQVDLGQKTEKVKITLLSATKPESVEVEKPEAKSKTEEVSFGEYSLEVNNGVLTAYRKGVPWENKTKELVGDNMVLAMVYRILELEQKLQEKNCVNF